MDNGHLCEEQEVPCGFLTALKFTVSSQAEIEKLSVLAIDAVSQVTDPRLGLPNPTSQCSTCGAQDLKSCEGHLGVIKLPFTILHPHFLSQVAKILNKVCPACKIIRKELRIKGAASGHYRVKGCKYCAGNSRGWYPRMRFRVSTQDIFRKTAIIVEVSENLIKNSGENLIKMSGKRVLKGVLPSDYWDFIPNDEQEEETKPKPNRRVLSHAQVQHLLDGVDPRFIQKFVSRTDLLFLNSVPVTPNCHRVTEVTHAFHSGQRLNFDGRTRAYRKLVGFRGIANELSSYVLDCLKVSKLVRSDNTANSESVFTHQRKIKDPVSHSTGSRWMKDVVLGKLDDYTFRMVVTGDPSLQLSEIGIPCNIAEKLQVSECLTCWNCERLRASCDLMLLEKGEIYIRRKGDLVRIHHTSELKMGDTIYRHLSDGDTILVLRPPSIHQHSLMALTVKVLPVTSNLSINPLCCSPLRGDFDGDCLHGYVPQSVNAKVELRELVSLDKQLINGQSGRNLLSLNQDSLTAAHLVMEDEVFLNPFQMQQLQMFCLYFTPSPAIIKAPSLSSRQLFNMLLPPDFDFVYSLNGVNIRKGKLLSFSEGSDWLLDNDANLFQSLVKHCQGKTLDFLFAAQEVLCEWLSTRGLSVSLSDLYLASDSNAQKNLMREVLCGLDEAEHTCNLRQMMVDPRWQLTDGSGEKNKSSSQLEHLCYEKQISAALSQASVDAFKQTFRAVQSLVFKYGGKDNSFLAMFKAGSKGNLLRLVQHSMCLGLQHSLVPLSFRFPHELSCEGWNNHKESLSSSEACDTQCAESYIPYAVVQSSFLSGLNPLESFVHSVMNRDSAFSDHADLPGTLSRKLMFFMRDLYIAYDGTVRNAYGNQVVQLHYSIEGDTSVSSGSMHKERLDGCERVAGQPVGSLSACAISEAAYSALDQPISLLETSPLLNLKNVLECGSKKGSTKQTASLFLSNKLERIRHGYEYGALEVKNHLERLLFKDIVSSVMIIFSPQACGQMHFSPWICHFHVCKEQAKRRGLKVHSVINSLEMRCKSAISKAKYTLPSFQIMSKFCSVAEPYEKASQTSCITVAIIERSKKHSVGLEWVRDSLIPFLLQTLIKGFREIKKVDILWYNLPNTSNCRRKRGELYLRVCMFADSAKTKLWSTLMNNCLQIMDVIDWTRSHPDNISDFCFACGIDAGWKYFLHNLMSAVSDTGKSVLHEHLLLVANALSISGEFVGLNARGILRQREHTSVLSPFLRACFSSPGDCFIRAAKAEIKDDLKGSLDALAWGNMPPVGSGGHFDIIYAGEGHKLSEPVDVYNLLSRQISSCRPDAEMEVPNGDSNGHLLNVPTKGLDPWESLPMIVRRCWTYNDIQKLSQSVRHILQKYPINGSLSEKDKSTLMRVLNFHPRKDEKIGAGAQDIKVANHSKYQNSRCFEVVRKDGTVTDFSYHKCVLGALKMVAPHKAKVYESKWLHFDKL